jgi:hypothetical protein
MKEIIHFHETETKRADILVGWLKSLLKSRSRDSIDSDGSGNKCDMVSDDSSDSGDSDDSNGGATVTC